MRVFVLSGLTLLLALLAGCATAPPAHPSNICDIFYEKPGWFRDAAHAERRWGVPISVQMAIIFQESGYHANARPPRTHILWVIPWRRPTSAYGYTQALNSTWHHYKSDTGHPFADRNDFGDATNFVGWYVDQSHQVLGLRKNDAYSQYLAYYLGPGGFRDHAYRHKPGLRHAAHRVALRARRYRRQLAGCRHQLEHPGHWWWPF